MDVIVATVNAFVVVAMGVVLGYITNGRYKALSARIDRLEARMDEGFNAVRSDLVRVALAVGAGGQAAEG